MRAQGGRPVPIFLVGTKADLADDRAVSDKERLAKARTWATKSFEVSAKADAGVTEVFTEIVTAALHASGDASKGSGGGSVMGAGMTPSDPYAVKKKRGCSFL